MQRPAQQATQQFQRGLEFQGTLGTGMYGCRPPCQTALGLKGSSELPMMARLKRASKPTAVRRLLIQLFNNLRRETCREAFKKRVAAPCSYLGPAGGPTALPTGFGLVSYCLQWALSRRVPLATATRPHEKSNLSLRLPPWVAMVRWIF